jgi:hypothetical protein
MQPETEDINPRLAAAAIFFWVAACAFSVSGVLLLTTTDAAAAWVVAGGALAVIVGVVLGLGIARYESGTAARDNTPLQAGGGLAMLLTGLGVFRGQSGFATLSGLIGILTLALAVQALVTYRHER